MLVYVPLNHIDDNPYQRRAEYGDIEELAERIHSAKESYPETLGLMQVPRGRVVVVDTDTVVGSDSVKRFVGRDGRWNEDPKTFRIQLAFGHRRKRAFEYLNRFGEKYDGDYYYMPIHIDPLTDKQMLDAVWAENYERKDISAVEQAELIQLKMQQLGESATHATIGQEWGLSRPVITNRLGLLGLPDSIKQANREGKLSERQCQALKPIIEIGQLAGKVKWGTTIGGNFSWETPAGPELVIEKAIAEPDKVTSDALREHTQRMLKHAGEQVPDVIASHKFGELGGIEQPQCKGCRFRINQYCLDTNCLKNKTKAWPDIALEKFSKKTGIPVSDRKADFYTDDYKAHARIEALYKADETGQMVCGWLVNCSAARPYDHSYVGSNSALGYSGRAGLALGWRGHLPEPEPEEGQDSAPRYSLPERDKILAWQTEAPKIAKQARKRLVETLANALAYQVAEFDVLQALMFAPEAEWIAEADKLAHQTVQFLLNKGQGVPSWRNSLYEECKDYQTAARRAGLDTDVMGAPVEALCSWATLILSRWYEHHDTSWRWEGTARELLPWIDEWDSEALSQAGGKELADMTIAISTARRHIEQKIAAEGEQAKAAETAVAAEDEAICAGCRDVLEPTDTITCSCGAVLCEDCYVEENHVFHDKDRDPVFDDLVNSFPELVEEETETAASPTDTNPAVAWLRAYVDDTGRTWRDLEPNQTHHANSPCFQAFTRAFPDEAEPKWQLKQARAVLEQEAAVEVEA